MENSIVISVYKYVKGNTYKEVKHNCFEVPYKNYCKIVNEQGDLAVIRTVGRIFHQHYKKNQQCWMDSTFIKLKGNKDFSNTEKEKYFKMYPDEKLAETGDPYWNGYNRETNDNNFFKDTIKCFKHLKIDSLDDLSISFIPKGEKFFITADGSEYGDETIYLKSKIKWSSA